MGTSLFFEGLIIGFVIAVPVGPIGLLCINRIMSGGPRYGLISGLGLATADAFWGGTVALGLTLISSLLNRQLVWLHPIGGIFLCYLGVKTFLVNPAIHVALTKKNRLWGAYSLMFFLRFTNPVTMLSFIAIYAGLGVASLSGRYFTAVLLTSGVFLGSALWWVILTSSLGLFRKKFTNHGLKWMHRISGAIIASVGFVVLLNP
ncbi:MAG: LysE family translocator [Candidatus Binatia bacterium]